MIATLNPVQVPLYHFPIVVQQIQRRGDSRIAPTTKRDRTLADVV